MKEDPLSLSPAERQVVEGTVRAHCRLRDWRMIGVNCRRNHVHVLLSTDGTSPEKVMRELKAYCTRALKVECGIARGRFWTRGGSTRYVWTEAALLSAEQYVRWQ